MQNLSKLNQKLSLTGAVPTLNEQFKAMPVFRKGGTQVGATVKPLSDPGFSWASGYVWNHNPAGTNETWPPPKANYPAWTTNAGTADVVPNADMIAVIGEANSPYAWYDHSGLCIQAKPTPPAIKKTVGKRDLPGDYISGTIISYPYAQRYGVFSANMMLPKGKGLWPAFWLLPADLSWPPEIDIVEMLGRDPKTIYQTVHANEIKGGQDGGYIQPGIDFRTSWHEYACDWGPKEIKFYFDRLLISSCPTPASLKKPCYLLANLSVGTAKVWSGAPAPKTTWFDAMRIKSIRAWQRPEYAGAV